MKILSNLQNVVCTVIKNSDFFNLFLNRKSINVVIVLYLIKLIQKFYTYRFKNEKSMDYLKIPIDDNHEEPLEGYLEQACNFIGIIF